MSLSSTSFRVVVLGRFASLLKTNRHGCIHCINHIISGILFWVQSIKCYLIFGPFFYHPPIAYLDSSVHPLLLCALYIDIPSHLPCWTFHKNVNNGRPPVVASSTPVQTTSRASDGRYTERK